MQYNVQGNLTIDIEEFEEAIKEAQEQLKKFKESFEELHKIKSSNQMETLVETVQKIREEIKGAKRESDSFNDSLQKEFNKTKKEAKGVATEVNTLDDSFEKTSQSAKKLAENMSSLKEERIKNINSEMEGYSKKIDSANKELQEQIKLTNKLEAEVSELQAKLEKSPNSRWASKWEADLQRSQRELNKSKSSESYYRNTIENYETLVSQLENMMKDLDNVTEYVSSDIAQNFEKPLPSLEQLKAELRDTRNEIKREFEAPANTIYGQLKPVWRMESQLDSLIRKASALKSELSTPTDVALFKQIITEIDELHSQLQKAYKDTEGVRKLERELLEPLEVLEKQLTKKKEKIRQELVNLTSDYDKTLRRLEQVKSRISTNEFYLENPDFSQDKSVKELEKELEKLNKEYNKLSETATNSLEKINKKTEELIKLNRQLKENDLEQLKIPNTSISSLESSTEKVKNEFNETSQASKKLVSDSEIAGKGIAEAFEYADKATVAHMNTLQRRMNELQDQMKYLRYNIKRNAQDFSYNKKNLNKSYADNNDNMIRHYKRELDHSTNSLTDYVLRFKELRNEMNQLKEEMQSVAPKNDTFEGMVTNLKHLEHQLDLSKKALKGFGERIRYISSRPNYNHFGGGKPADLRDAYGAFHEEMERFKKLREKANEIRTQLKEDFGIIFEDVASSINADPLKAELNKDGDFIYESLNKIAEKFRLGTRKIKDESRKLLSVESSIERQMYRMDIINRKINRDLLKEDGTPMNVPLYKRLMAELESRKMIISAYKGEIKSLPDVLTGISDEEMSKIRFNLKYEGNIKSLSEDIDNLKAEINSLNSAYSDLFRDNTGMTHLSAQLKHLKEESINLKKEITRVVSSLRDKKSWIQGDNKQEGLLHDIYKEEESALKSLVNKYNEVQTQMSEVQSKIDAQLDGVVKYDDGIDKLANKLARIQELHTAIWQVEQLEPYYSMVQAVTGATKEQLSALQKMVMLEKELYTDENKYFNLTSPYSRQTSMWINEQITDFNNLWRSHSKYYRGIKKEQTEAVQYIKEMNLSIKEQQMLLKEGMGVGFAGSGKFNEGMLYGEKFLKNVERIKSTFSSMKSFNFNKALGINEINDAKLKDAINFFNSLQEKTRLLREETSRDFLGTKQFAEAIEYSNKYVESMMKVKSATESIASSASSRRNMFFNESELNRTVGSYQRFRNEQQLLNRSTISLSSGFGKLGEYSKSASSQVSTLGGVLRSLRTTMSMIGGMFVWEFAFKIVDATQSTIKAKSEMESYYKSLNMGSKEIGQFNTMLDKTIGKFQKMNKFQLGETITALGVEFKLNTEEMNQIAKVAPMIVNEYLRAGRSTEEAILAIKDISQGEFLRLSRETGVGAKEIKEAGWNGDNKDIVSLYEALEKIGKARHWDTFASKATSLNDVLLITENRMTEFATLISDWVTPMIVMGFNAMGDAFTKLRLGYEGLDPTAKSVITTLGGLGFSLGTIATLHYKAIPAMEAFATSMLSNVLGIDKEIAKTYGLSTAIGHQVAVEKVATAQKNLGSSALDIRINKLKAEEMANKLGLETTELKIEYEQLQAFALNETSISMNEKLFAQKALLLAEEQGITVEEAKNALLVEEKIAQMGTLEAMMAYKLGLDMSIVANNGLKDAILVKIGFMEADALATEGATASTLTFIATMGILLLPIALVVASIALLTAKFLELQSSMETVTKTLDESPDKIDTLTDSVEKQEKAVDKVKKRFDEGKASATELSMANEKLVNLQDQLYYEQKKYDQALQISHRFQKNTADMEAKRATHIKEINKELRENHRLSKEIYGDSDMAKMGSAWAESYKLQQINNYTEEHRKERNDQLIKNLENANKSDEEIINFANDWNMAYTDRQIALEKMADPSSDTWTRLGAYWDNWWASAKLSWIEFWADPFKGFGEDIALPSIDFGLDLFGLGDSQSNYEFFKGIDEEITNWLNDFNKITIDDLFDFTGITSFSNWLNDLSVGGNFGQGFNDALTSMSSAWDSFSQPIVDFFNNLSVPSDWNPFKGWNFDIDSFIRDNLISDGSGGVASKSIDLSSILSIDFSGFKLMFDNGFRNSFGDIPSILTGAGQIWKGLSTNNGKMVIDGIKSVLNNLPQVVKDPLQAGARVISNMGHTWGTNALNTAKRIYDGIKNGIGDLASIVKGKLDAVTSTIKGIRKEWEKATQGAVNAIKDPIGTMTSFFSGSSGAYGTYGFKGTVRRPRTPSVAGTSNIRLNRPVYGMSNGSFETVLTGLLTSQGFRSPSSYQYYPNNRKTPQETWDSGKGNCFDGAMLIASLGSMFGLKSRLIFGTYNGQGHTGAMVGGKLYDMTQFQKRGVFRGTKGVHFGTGGGRSSNNYGSKNVSNKSITINVTNDLSNARIYGIDDLDNHIKKTTEKTIYEMNSPDGALGY